jgi:predicted nucleic acid-binding protein
MYAPTEYLQVSLPRLGFQFLVDDEQLTISYMDAMQVAHMETACKHILSSFTVHGNKSLL